MKKLFLATISFAALAAGAPAGAADMPVKGPPMVRPACAQFGGFYVGAHAGWTYHDSTWVDRDTWVDNFGTDWALGSVNRTHDGFSGGAQAGYNWQFGCTVFGVEIDGSWADLDSTRTHSASSSTTINPTVLTLHNKVEWYGTLRTRTGVVVDNLLLFVTGGFAYANIKHDWRIDDAGSTPTFEAFSARKDRWGWVAGVGTEWAFTPNLSIKSEALYVRFSEESRSGFSPNGVGTVNFDNQDSFWIGRVGLNYRFGGNPF